MMRFWGIKVSPGKPYYIQGNRNVKRLYISQATLLSDGCSLTKGSVAKCETEKSTTVLCSLAPSVMESCVLDLLLEFDKYEDVIFFAYGNHSIFLTGFYLNRGCYQLSKYSHSFLLPPLQANTKNGGQRKCKSRQNHLEKKYHVSDSDEVVKDASRQPTTMKESTTVCSFDIEKKSHVSDSDEVKFNASQQVQAGMMGESTTVSSFNIEKENTCLISILRKSETFKRVKMAIMKTAEDEKQHKFGIGKVDKQNIGDGIHILKPKERDSKDLKSKKTYHQTRELDQTYSITQESNANLQDQKKLKRKKGDNNEHVTSEDDSKTRQLKELSLENVEANEIVSEVQEFGAHPQDHRGKLKKKHTKKVAKSKTTMTVDEVREPLQSKCLCLGRTELDQQIGNVQRTNAGLQKERIHGLEVDKFGDENEFGVKTEKRAIVSCFKVKRISARAIR